MVRKRRESVEAHARRRAAVEARSWRSSGGPVVALVSKPAARRAEVWPPARAVGDRWVERLVLEQGRASSMRLRLVRLWGRTVAVDEEGRVWCPTCKRLVGVDELAGPVNTHPLVGLPRRSGLVLLPLGEDRPPRSVWGRPL